jgi:hypothetical protein
MTETQNEIHNRLAGALVRTILEAPIYAGGDFPDALVILESVVFGVTLIGTKVGFPADDILDELVLHVRERLAKERMTLPGVPH